MAPFPEEVDVFSEPHSRMKRLVEVYSEKLSSMDFLNDEALESFLYSLQETFCEFKTHEQIENKLIMAKLEKKLKALSIHDAAVCNCHNDSRLVEMLALVRDGYSCTHKPFVERQNYALKLENALNQFTQDFIPHMQEEEEVFQPLLVKYFEYEELKLLKERVLLEHSKWQQGHLLTHNVEKDAREVNAQSDKKEDVDPLSPFECLPPEVISQVFSFLSPRDLLSCSAVCKEWNSLAYDSSLWKRLSPCQWADGKWVWHHSVTALPTTTDVCPCSQNSPFLDEDADLDDQSNCSPVCEIIPCGQKCKQKQVVREKRVLFGVVHSLLPHVGQGVQRLHLADSTALTSRLLLSLLKQCPNLRYLDVSYTGITDTAFKGLQDFNACQHLEHLDLSGCEDITDLTLERLAKCFSQRALWRVQPWETFLECPYTKLPCPYARKNITAQLKVPPKIKLLSLSGCYQITDYGIHALSSGGLLSKCEHLDVSGCWQLTGTCLQEAVHSAPLLAPDKLFYCNYIENGPYEDLANGCDNLECALRACCCKGD